MIVHTIIDNLEEVRREFASLFKEILDSVCEAYVNRARTEISHNQTLTVPLRFFCSSAKRSLRFNSLNQY